MQPDWLKFARDTDCQCWDLEFFFSIVVGSWRLKPGFLVNFGIGFLSFYLWSWERNLVENLIFDEFFFVFGDEKNPIL